jgi:hypothetical protein
MHPPLYFNNVPIKNVTTHKHLGLTFSNDGSWTIHINEIITKASSRLICLTSFEPFASLNLK